jgi:hypothetical protein
LKGKVSNLRSSETIKGVFSLRQWQGGHGSRHPLRIV